MSEQLRIQLFGPLQVSTSDRFLSIPTGVRSLLAYLALRVGMRISRDELIGGLWPDSDEGASRPRLRQSIWRLRRALRPVHPDVTIETTATTVSLLCQPTAIDAVRFKQLVTASRNDRDALREAVEIYRGALLLGETDDWIEQDRFHYQALFLRVAKDLATRLISEGAGAEAMAYARRAVELDPTDEEATYALMQAAVLAGEPNLALAQYDALARALKDDIEVTPAPHVTRLFEDIRAATHVRHTRTNERNIHSTGSADGFLADAVALIGRSAERQQLMRAIQRVRAGHSSAFIITGSPGVGKTRLADAISVEAQLVDVPVCKGRCSDVPDAPPYHPIVEALWPQLSSAVLGKSPTLSALVSNLIPRKSRRQGQSAAGSPIDAAMISESLLRILPSADEPPILLLLDDVHRADHATWALLISLLGRLVDLSVCLVLTARIGETEEQDRSVAQLAAVGAEVIELQPLDAEGVKALVSFVLGIPRSPGLLWRAIARHVGGNPLQILEAIRLLKGRGLLKPSGGTWAVDPQTPEVLGTLASSQISTLIQQRIALLPQSCRNVLSAAAVFGTQISPEHLRGLVGLPQQRFISYVELLIRNRLLISGADATLMFPHEEIRNTVLEQVTPIRKRWLHARAAQLLSHSQTARPEDLYWHCNGAGNIVGAFSAAIAAGNSSYAVGEHASAIAWYERALAVLTVRPQEFDLRTRVDLELKLEAALDQHGDRPRQLAVLQSAGEIAERLGFRGELCEVLIRRSLCLTRMNQRGAAIDSAQRAGDLARHSSDLHHEAHAHRAMGLAYEYFSDAEVIRFLNKALHLFKQLGARQDESLALSELATAYDRLGNHTLALKALDRAAALLPSDDRSRAILIARRAGALLWTGHLSETITAAEESLALLQRYGDRITEARVMRVLADAHAIAGRYRESLAANLRGLQISKRANDARLVASILNSLIASVYSHLGLTRRSRATFDRLINLLGTDPHERYRALCEDSLSMAYLQAGRWEESRYWAEQALSTAAVVDREWYASAEARLHLAHALLELHDPAAAKENLLISLRYLRSSGELPHQAFATALLAVASIDLGERHEAEEFLRESIRLVYRVDVLQDSHQLYWLHGHVWSRLGQDRPATRAFRTAYAELNRVAASLGAPLRRRFLDLPFQRRVLEAASQNPPTVLPAECHPDPVSMPIASDTLQIRSLSRRRQAVLRALTSSAKTPTRRALAAALGVTPRTITNDIAALRRAGHQIELPRITH